MWLLSKLFTPKLDISKNLYYASLCKEVYKREFEMDVDTHNYGGYKKIKFIDNKETDTQLIILENEEQLLIVFRGTGFNNLKEFIRDANIDAKFKLTDFPYFEEEEKAQVHHGFLKSYESVRDEILQIVVEKSDKSKILTMGHSLGGALSQICTLDIIMNYNWDDAIENINFGCPRVGNRKFTNCINKKWVKLTRFIHIKDPVPNLPPMAFFDYRHAGVEIALGSGWSCPKSIKKHNMPSYYNEIENL